MTQTSWIFSLSQFYLSLAFALIFLALELGLSWVLVIYRIRAKRSVAALYAYRFWVRVFALCCVLAFAASVPVILNLGIIWPRFMDRIGEVAGPLIGLAILTTFVFKSCFLGVMLYGQRILSDLAHVFVLLMVALGSSLTSYWVIAFFAWQQQPSGAYLFEGHYLVNDWLAVLGGNAPLFFALFLLTSFLLVIALKFLVMARQTQIRPSDQGENGTYAFACFALVICILAQIPISYWLGIDLLNAQPGRLAAVIPKWSSDIPGINFTLLASLTPELAQNNWQFEGLPGVRHLIDYVLGAAIQNTNVVGLDKLSGLHPPLWFTYFSARFTVFLSIVLLALSIYILYKAKQTSFDLDTVDRAKRFVLRLTAWLIIAWQLIGWAHLFIGILPFATYESITLRELVSINNQNLQLVFLILQLLLYGLLIMGLRNLIVHNIRFGVIPVSRHRGRA